ncbi:MAG: copper-binding protein [Zoogloea sp.]|nr:copper-binding protein [Zoogloea sp.]
MRVPLAPVLAAIIATVSASAFAASTVSANDHAGHAKAHAAQGEASMQMADGIVKKVDKPTGRITVSHGPLPNGMPAMTMAFRVKDAAWIDKLKEGDKIRFMAEQINGAMTLVHIERP